MAVKYGTWDSNISLSLAFFVNAAILIVAAAVFHFGPHANQSVADITTAYKLLAPAVGDSVAPKLFAVALLCSGQQSTITGQKSLFPRQSAAAQSCRFCWQTWLKQCDMQAP